MSERKNLSIRNGDDGGLGNSRSIPSWIILVQCICFAVMYSIWNHPQTNFLSDACMTIGALLSSYVIYVNHRFFKTKDSIPLWLLVILLAWIIFHLQFLSNDYELQLRELKSIWKRVVIVSIFALGFGMALSKAKTSFIYWIIFYCGMLMPSIIFLLKYSLSVYASHWTLPEYLILYPARTSIYYLYKTDYTTLCLPALAISLGALKKNLQNCIFSAPANILYLFGICTALEVFYLGSIKNGMAYSVIFIVIFIFSAIRIKLNYARESKSKLECPATWPWKALMILILITFLFATLSKHVEQNPSWKSLWVDAKIAVQVEQIDKWKYFGAKGYPLNELGNQVSNTNYERIAWGIVGLKLLKENPYGYGLVYRSFASLSKRSWPDSTLDQSHSAWLDLALGIGIPGLSLVLGAFFMVLFGISSQTSLGRMSPQGVFWSTGVTWVFWSILLVWLTSEVSQKAHIIALVFWISLGAGLSIGRQNNSYTQNAPNT